MRFLVIALFLVKSFCCFAQDDSATVHFDSVIDNYFCIKTSPLAFFDPFGGFSYRLGAEVKLMHNTAFSFEIGKYYGIGKEDGLKRRPKGFIFRPEFKYYVEGPASIGSYVSLEFFYKKFNFGYLDSVHQRPVGPYEVDYRIFKEIYGFNLRGGEMIVSNRKRIVVESFFGAGIRIIRGHNTLTPAENDHVLTGEGHGDLVSDGQRLIKGVWPNFTMGIKIGFAFVSKKKRYVPPKENFLFNRKSKKAFS